MKDLQKRWYRWQNLKIYFMWHKHSKSCENLRKRNVFVTKTVQFTFRKYEFLFFIFTFFHKFWKCHFYDFFVSPSNITCLLSSKNNFIFCLKLKKSKCLKLVTQKTITNFNVYLFSNLKFFSLFNHWIVKYLPKERCIFSLHHRIQMN